MHEPLGLKTCERYRRHAFGYAMRASRVGVVGHVDVVEDIAADWGSTLIGCVLYIAALYAARRQVTRAAAFAPLGGSTEGSLVITTDKIPPAWHWN
jgi:hypothetical protein